MPPIAWTSTKGLPGDLGRRADTVTVAEPVTGYHMFKYTTRPSTVEYHKAGAPQTGAVAWIAAKGYPNVESQSVFAKNLDDVDARSVTQLAIWIASGQVRVEGGEDSSKATKAVSVANPGHQVAGAGYSSGGQQNFAPYTMIGLAWLLAQKALNAEDRDEYEAVFYEPVGTAGTLQRMLYARRVPKKAHPRTVTMRKVATNAAYTTANEAYDMTGARVCIAPEWDAGAYLQHRCRRQGDLERRCDARHLYVAGNAGATKRLHAEFQGQNRGDC